MSIIIGIDHGYYAIKTVHCSFPAGLTSYGEHEPYTRQGLLEFVAPGGSLSNGIRLRTTTITC